MLRRLLPLLLAWLALPAGAEPAPRPLTAPDPSAPLYAKLPPEIQRAGVLRFVGDSHPPYRIVNDRRQIADGLEPDLARRMERLLGVPIKHHVVNSLSATMAGLEAGRYDLALGPGVATLERQKRFDGVSWLTTRPAFVFPLDRPARYSLPMDLCGKKISYVAGSVSERVTNRLNERCIAEGRPPAQHVALVDTNMTLVATQAGRASVAAMTLSAALHAVHINPDRFGMYSDASGSLGRDLLSLFVPKRSGLAPVIHEAMSTLMQNGQYAEVMERWGVSAVAITQSQINAAK